MAHADDRRGKKRPGSDPADRRRPIRASARARLRGEDGVRRDDFYGIRSQGPPDGQDPAPGQDSHPGQDSSSAKDISPPADGTPRPAAEAGTGTAPSHSSLGTPPAPSPGERPASQTFPSRRARREALARQREQEGLDRGSHSDAYDPTPAAPTFDDEVLGGLNADPSADTATPRHAARRSSAPAQAPTTGSGSGSAPASASAGTTGSTRAAEAGTTAAGAAAASSAGAAASTTSSNATAQDDAAPRHSRREGDAFPSIVQWTALGTLLPGLGLIRGRRPAGWILLLGFIAVILAGLGWIIWRSPVKAVARVAGSPTILYAIAIVLLIGLVIWALTILRSYAVLKKGHRMTGAQKWLGWGLVASLILCVGIPLGVGSVYSKVHADTVIQVFGRDGQQGVDVETLWGDTERINVFLIGRDDGDGRDGTRPDTMLVASIEPASGDTTLISVPRNLNRAQFPEGSQLAERFPYGFDGFGPEESMINAVWTWAEEYPDEVGDVPANLDTGMEATMQAVEGSLGLGLDYYASVDMQGFEDVVDAIGGVKIDVERPIPIGGGTNLNTGMKNPVYGWIDPGEQKLAGSQALWYVRSRDGADNYDRMCRQQRMLKLTIDQVNPQELAIAYPKLAGSAGRNILTDVPQSQVSAFVELAVAMQRGEIKSAQITNDVTSTSNPDYELLHEWVQEQIDPAEPSQAEDETGESEETTEPEETEEPEPTGAPAAGIEDAEGKCYPKGYTPGTGWPGWPGDEEA